LTLEAWRTRATTLTRATILARST